MKMQHAKFGFVTSFVLVFCASGFLVQGDAFAESDWRVWRGPTRDNHVDSDQAATIPTKWDTSSNVLWKSAVVGKGHATPIVVDEGVYVLTHEPAERVISLLRYNVRDGKQVGRVVLHRNVVPPSYLHKKNTCASSTPSSDGKGIFTVAQVNDEIIASALTTTGKIVWQQPVAPYRAGRGWFGFGSSPLLLSDQVVAAVDVDNRDGGLFSLDRKTGRRRWKTPRTESASYATPILANVAGRDQILMSGGYRVASYDPKTGKQLWTVPATSRTTCNTIVWTNDMVFASGSYPDAGTFGIKVTGSGAKIAWENGVKCYEQSMLVVGEYLYGIADSGVTYCWRCSDGAEQWKTRLKGPFSASPLLVGDKIFASNERGTTFVFAADPTGYQPIAQNQLGESSFASPIVADGKLLLRHAIGSGGNRQEFLFAIGQ